MLERAELVRSADPEQFNELVGQLNASIKAASDRQRQKLEYLKAYQLSFSGRFDLGIEAAKTLFENSTDIETKVQAGSLIVNSYAATRDFSEGLRYLNQMIGLVDEVGDPEIRHHAWAAAGSISNHVGQYEQGIRYADLMLADSPSARTSCFAGALRMEAFYNMGQLSGRETEVRTIIDECVGAGEPLFANYVRAYHARLMADRGDRNGAIVLLSQHLDEVEATKYPRVIGEVYATLAEAYLAAGDYEAADRFARGVMRHATAMASSAPLVTAHRVLYESALQRGNNAAALAHHINYFDANSAYLNEVKARALVYEQVLGETREKNQTIELLNRENQVLQLREEASALATRNTQLAIALLAVLLGTIAFWAWRTKRSQVKFQRLAETDALTGVSNRMDFSRRAEQALAYCSKDGEEVGLVMFDLDEFKSINDRFGHATGDWVLQEVAKVCSDICRKNDRFGRLGGEEFAFLLVGCDLPSSVALAQACRKRIAAIDTTSTGHAFAVTASFGVSGTRASGYDFLTLLSRADDALYQAKHAGRDRVRTHGLEADTTTVAAN
ncbi:hypothetical protein N788_12415 [Arenimonas donghaensis DSM 18148 = HO3-R19]|uniref:diguanylate cyclase n=1 Tax=Arenimonas donghaensis DSM 18148 = HO3-R19 TaxID=1121014 RepID=A0A087MJ72_9GAMM|nr:hypothetical protein N788_12415 [Arenimonas donghaensis DSM 18148 = HO3-R19]